MKNLKKVLAFVVVFAMMFSFAVSANTPFPDVPDEASYAEAATILNALKLMIGDDQGNFNPDQTITRAEAATVIVRAKGLGDAAAGAVGPTPFTDVPADHWASGFINIASQSGIVAGYGDGTFGPSDPVTYEQMVKLIVAALGYTPKAEVNGGYPTGYLVIASQKNITKGATGNSGDPAPRKTVARLVFNALDVNMMEQTGFGKGEESFEEVDRTLLDLLDVEKAEGIVESTYLTNYAGNTTSKTVTIHYEDRNRDDVWTPEVGDTNAADYFGYYVTAYMQDDEVTGDETLVAIAPKSGRNETLTLDYTQIDKGGIDANNKLWYRLNQTDKTSKSINIDEFAVYYINGDADKDKALDFINQNPTEAAEVQPGKVTFLKNNTGDAYNYVFVTAYGRSYVVDEINASKQRVYDKEGDSMGIDMEDEDKIYTFYKTDGSLGAFEDIKVGDVLTLVSNKNKDVNSVYICDNTVEGKVTEVTTDLDAYYRIDGSLYRLDHQNPYISTLNAGDDGKFYLNVDNRVVYKDVKATGSAGTYAYLVDADLTTGLGGDKVEVKVLTSEGKFVEANIASRLTVSYAGSNTTIDSAKATNGGRIEALYTIEDGADKLANVNNVLFKYALNSSGDIYKVWISPENKGEYSDSYFSLNDKVENQQYNAYTKKLGRIFVQDDTPVFSVPSEKSTDEKEFTVSNAKALFADGTSYKLVESYDLDGGYPSVLVAYDAKADIDETTRLFVLTSVATGNNAEGYEVTKFYGYQEGKAVSAESSGDEGVIYLEADGKTNRVDENGDEKPAQAGDAVIFSLDAAGKIDKVAVLMSLEDAEALKATGYHDGDDSGAEDFFGRAVKKQSGNRLELEIDGLAEGENVIPIKGTYNVYEVSPRSGRQPVINTSDYGAIEALKDPKAGDSVDYVYVRMYEGAVVDVVVYTLDYPDIA